jgi:hypothetical protein
LSDVHVPKLESHSRGKTALKIVLEVALISVGVFLGLLGEQWRESTHQRDLAKESLRRFRAEILENRDAVAAVASYHVARQKELQAALAKGPERFSGDGIHLQGIRWVTFDHSAWDLAIAAQSLAYVDADLALSLARVYNLQNFVTDLSRGVMQAMYVTPPINDNSSVTFFGSVLIYYNDVTIFEPRLLEMYDAILPSIDAAIGEKKKSSGADKKAAG